MKSTARLFVNDVYIESYTGSGRDAWQVCRQKVNMAIQTLRASFHVCKIPAATFKVIQDGETSIQIWTDSDSFYGSMQS